MATSSSSSPGNNKVGVTSSITEPNATGTPQRSAPLEMPRENIRAINKPKCINCGNVARSRCPFYSCKRCCSKAQNACHIHAIKTSGTLPDKPQSSISYNAEQAPTDMHSSGASRRLKSYRKISTNLANSLPAKKPLSWEDAVHVNKWRFSKLREHIEGEIEAEDEAFGRYMRNASLLEELFSTDDESKFEELPSEHSFEKIQKPVPQAKLKLKPNVGHDDEHGEKMSNLLDHKPRGSREGDIAAANIMGPSCSDGNSPCGQVKRAKQFQERTERTSSMDKLIDKLYKARSTDDLGSCLQLKRLLFGQLESEGKEAPQCGEFSEHGKVSVASASRLLTGPGVCDVVVLDPIELANVEAEFSTADQITQL